MSTWILLEDFAKIVGKSEEELKTLCDLGAIVSKEEDEQIFVEIGSGTQMVLKDGEDALEAEHLGDMQVSHAFAEKTIGTIMAFHEKVIEAKDETLEALRQENKFLKEGLISMQDIYEDDKKTAETLRSQIALLQEELEFTKRKYKLMWGQVVESHNKQ
jgi:hypothetical protein